MKVIKNEKNNSIIIKIYFLGEYEQYTEDYKLKI